MFVCFLFLLTASGSVAQKKRRNPALGSVFTPKISARLQAKILSSGNTDGSVTVWIYFRDKGTVSQTLSRRKQEEIQQDLLPHCLWRRAKVRSQADLIDEHDAPLYASYIDQIIPEVKRVRTVSRWLNALSAEITAAQLQFLGNCDFVRKIDLVMSFRRSTPSLSVSEKSETGSLQSLSLDYGPSFGQLDQMNVIPLHESGFSGKNVVVCLLDTGFRKSHEIFRQAHVIAEWDFVNNDSDVEQEVENPEDYSDSHGTGTWSVLGGYKPGELIGPAYQASFILGKTETSLFEQPIEEDYWVAGVEWAEALGAEVISSSLGYTDWYTFQDMDGQTAVTTIAANRATSLGVVVVNAVGNERAEAWGHIIAPSDGFDVIAVGAVDQAG
ncbi:MAG: S8 family serine peptidase, partial [Candidatus Aminicenantes bacterium]|nr:S8 family serine peptidase [Candidatus Aminicenantes bacterium]